MAGESPGPGKGFGSASPAPEGLFRLDLRLGLGDADIFVEVIWKIPQCTSRVAEHAPFGDGHGDNKCDFCQGGQGAVRVKKGEPVMPVRVSVFHLKLQELY